MTMVRNLRATLSVTVVLMSTATTAANSQSTMSLTFPQSRGATHDEIRKYQALGKFVVAPDGSSFLYEWSRPYNWAPLRGALTRTTQRRLQTSLYRVSVPAAADWSDLDPPTTEILLPAAPGATYYLGALSPDAKRATFYELDRDDNTLRAGIVLLSDSLPRDITWLSLSPDEARLDESAIWLSNDEVVYPIRSGAARMARASAQTGRAEPCQDCDAVQLAQVPVPSPTTTPDAGEHADSHVAMISSGVAPAMPATAKVIARSADGTLLIYAVDTAGILALYFTRKGRVVELFRNQRSSGVASAQ